MSCLSLWSKVLETETRIIWGRHLCFSLEAEEQMPGESWPKFPPQGWSLWPWTLCFNSPCLSPSAARRSQIGYILNISVERNRILQYVTGRCLLPGRSASHHAGLKTEAEAGHSWWELPASSREACPQVAPGGHASLMWLFSVPSESG